MLIPCTSDCAERSITCHGTREKYKQWKIKYDEEKKRIKYNQQKYAFETERYTMGRTRIKREAKGTR